MKQKLLLFLFLILANTIAISCKNTEQTYSIKLNLKNASIQGKVYLQKYTGKTLTSIDSIVFANNNEITFSGITQLKAGMYTLAIGAKLLANFFISDSNHQNFSISLDLNNPAQSLSFANSPENQAFINYLRFMGKQQHTQEAQAAIKQKGDELIQQFQNSMLALFIQTMQEPEIPESNYPVKNHQEYAMIYYINHFFDNINFADQRLLNTPLLEQKLGTYFKQMVPPLPDSINEKVELVLYKATSNEKVFNWTVRYLYNLYREAPIEGNTEVYNFIGENYILTEPNRWNDPFFVEKVSSRVVKSKLNPIGDKTTNLILQTPEGKIVELYKVEAKYNILFFFNPDCEACQPVSEALTKLYQQYKTKDIEVFAVYMDHQKEEWQNYIKVKNLNWINVYDPTGAASIEQKYDIYAIPMIYVLDKEKMILAKDISVEKLEDLIKEP